MTCIAWDGTTLAADKRVSFGGVSGSVTKVHRINGLLVGGSGVSAHVEEMLQWIRDGLKQDAFPRSNRNLLTCASVLVVLANGRVHQYENTSRPIILEDAFWAIGSGRNFAMTAMHLGKTAREAVEIACLFDSGCGNGIDTLTLT